jgi:hypothetical protein
MQGHNNLFTEVRFHKETYISIEESIKDWVSLNTFLTQVITKIKLELLFLFSQSVQGSPHSWRLLISLQSMGVKTPSSKITRMQHTHTFL